MDYATRTLGDICDEVGGIVRTGPFGSQLHESDYRERGIPVVMPKNLIDCRISIDDIAFIGEDDADRLRQHRLEKGDIVYGRRGDIGRRALITERESGWLCGTGCIRISLGDSVLDPIFLFYYLGQPNVIEWIYNQAIGATLPNLNTSIIRSIPIKYPLIPIQCKIAAILSAYDDLIENNTLRIKILEEMAQALYREWFIYFKFPGHDNVQMEGSPLGMKPLGWEITPFTDVSKILSGGTPKTSVPEFWDGNIPFFTPKDAASSFYVLETDKSITEKGLEKCNSQLYPKDTVFITARGTVGKIIMPAFSMAMNQSCYALRGKSGIGQYYIFLTINNCIDKLKQSATGAVFDTIVIDTFRTLEIVRPPRSLISDFCSCVEPLFSQILNLLRRNNLLREMRDLLLPRLISGEIDITKWKIDRYEIAKYSD